MRYILLQGFKLRCHDLRTTLTVTLQREGFPHEIIGHFSPRAIPWSADYVKRTVSRSFFRPSLYLLFSFKSPLAPHPHTIDPFDHGYLKLLLAGPWMIYYLFLGILLAAVCSFRMCRDPRAKGPMVRISRFMMSLKPMLHRVGQRKCFSPSPGSASPFAAPNGRHLFFGGIN